MKPVLKIDWATHDAAEYACRKWHYSKCVPRFKTVKIGAWENDRFIGVVLFGSGATPEIGSPYGLAQTEICELTRVALTNHESEVSRIVAIAIKFLKRHSPGLRLIVSFADAAQGHHGGIYQAGGWFYLGGSVTHGYKVNGEIVHPKTLYMRYGKGGQSVPWLRENIDKNAERITAGFKHRYVMPLDGEMRDRLQPLRKQYPKRGKEQDAGNHPALGGATPTTTLQTSKVGAGGTA